MNEKEDIALINKLLAHSMETEWLEFKRNYHEPKQIGKYLSALANSAYLAGQNAGYLIFGVDDKTHKIVGTDFDPYKTKERGQDLLLRLRAGLIPNTEFNPVVVNHPDGRVVIFKISPAKGQPVKFKGIDYIRVGASTTELGKHPEKARAIWIRETDWSAEVCERAGMDDLDKPALSKAREQFITKHREQKSEIEKWDDVTFLSKARILQQGSITNAALLLLGKPESSSLLAPKAARISWILKDGRNQELEYHHIDPPFITAGDRLLEHVRNLTVRVLPRGTLFPKEITQYDHWVIREALHNSIAHQDYWLQGRIVVVEFPDRVLLKNVGDFLPGDVEAVILRDAPQTIYRNRFLANAMVELNLIDTQGGGIKRMFNIQKERSFPLPDYDLTESNHVTVHIHGRILDDRYTRLLMERTDLDLEQVMALDRVQKKVRISKEAHRRLKADKLVEGRYPNLMVAESVAKATGETGRHIRELGFDDQYYMDMILALIRQHGPANRQQIDQAVASKLPDRFTKAQKQRKVGNLLQQMRRSKQIVNQGTRSQPMWGKHASKHG